MADVPAWDGRPRFRGEFGRDTPRDPPEPAPGPDEHVGTSPRLVAGSVISKPLRELIAMPGGVAAARDRIAGFLGALGGRDASYSFANRKVHNLRADKHISGHGHVSNESVANSWLHAILTIAERPGGPTRVAPWTSPPPRVPPS